MAIYGSGNIVNHKELFGSAMEQFTKRGFWNEVAQPPLPLFRSTLPVKQEIKPIPLAYPLPKK